MRSRSARAVATQQTQPLVSSKICSSLESTSSESMLISPNSVSITALERPRLDLLPGAGDADDGRDAPAAVAALERLAHHVDVADAFEAVIRAPTGNFHDF